MQRLKTVFTIGFLFLFVYSFPQSSKRIKKNLTVFLSGSFDTSAAVSFDKKNPEKHGWEYADKKFEKAFSSKGFKVGKSGGGHRYVLVMDYDYGYLISAYKMQYSNLRGEILDGNTSQPIGTFSYNGRYENDELADAIALQLNEIIKDQLAHPQAQKNPVKSKEDRLLELKNLLDKGLITKEDYENQKTKILNEL